jgi:diguanylate cyclase (GGDEF)-like protein
MSNQISKNFFIYICDNEGNIKTVVNSINDDQNSLKDEKIFDQILLDNQISWNSQILNFEDKKNHKHWKGFLTNIGEETYACYLAKLGNDQIMVLGLKNDIQEYLIDEVFKINVKLTNKIRTLSKDKSLTMTDEFNEISKINNELANARRELVKKNHKLEELNLQLEQLIIKDFLTGLFNRRHFYSFSPDVASRAKRLKHSCSLIMIDINDFKNINDEFGHDAGDKLLVHLAKCMKNTFRSGQDTLFRFGGDEFLIILEASNYNDSMLAMKRLKMLYEKDAKGTSLAAGIVEIGYDEIQDDFSEFIKKADSLMYEEKEKFRKNK